MAEDEAQSSHFKQNLQQGQAQVKTLTIDYVTYLQNGKSLKNCTIGEYIVQKTLGQGNFGQVYLAKSRRGYNYALKLLDLKEVSEQKHPRVKAIRERLVESEPRLMQLCNSPNLIKCYDIYENKELKVLIMEYCNQGTLSDELKKIRKFQQKDAVQVLRNIINGIAELHRHSIVHRDLKTDNIMKHDGVYKIIDFGFSKKLQIDNEFQQTKNTLLGTQTTMAPQVYQRKNYGLKADIWSLGIIFFEMVFGIQPYDSSNANKFYETIQKKVQEVSSTLYGVTLSENAVDFLQKVLKVNTDDRIGWREMVEHPLIKIKANEPLAGRFVQREDLIVPQVKEALKKGSLISAEFDFEAQKELKESPKTEDSEKKKVKIKLQLLSNKNGEVKKLEQKKDQVVEPKNPQIVNPVVKGKQAKINLQKAMEEDRQREKQRRRREQREREQGERKRRQIEKQQIAKTKRVSELQSQSYHKCLSFHLQCLKTQLIFRQIVEPIESRNLLNLQRRSSIELMNLLLARCFKNMSPLKLYLKNNAQSLSSNAAFRNLQLQIEHLYNEVSAKFKEYDQKLLAQENKYVEIAKDFVLKVFKGNEEKQKNRMLGGVENRADHEFGDFTKLEQIEYTCKCIEKVVPEMLELGEYSKRVKKLLQFYNFITTITLEELGDETYHEYVNRLIY